MNFCLISSYVKDVSRYDVSRLNLFGGGKSEIIKESREEILEEARRKGWISLPKEHLPKLQAKANDQMSDLIDDQTMKQHVEHCLHNLVRIAYQAKEDSGPDGPLAAFDSQKSGQFGLNIGRAQEILEEAPGITGGVDVWWRFFKTDIKNNNFDTLMKKALFRIIELGLDFPDDEFLKS